MKRRQALAGMIAAVWPGFLTTAVRAQENAAPPLDALLPAWEAWKAAYLAPEGRVVDILQQGASHSESQGYGLFLATAFADNAAFDSIYGWTETNLAIRPDALLAWRWLPDAAEQVADTNNASDGDIFYAWALAIRAGKDGSAELLTRATAIAADLAARYIVPHPDGSGRLLLAPAAVGFDRAGETIVNFSYYMPLAMRELARATGVAILATCAADGEALMADLAAEGLMPDWIQIGPLTTSVAEGMSDQNGYEALRIAPFLAWSGNAAHPAVRQQAKAYRAAVVPAGQTATVFDRRSGAVIEASPDAGYAAIAALIDCAVQNTSGAALRAFTAEQPYYPATLHLMTLIAQITVYPRCFPL